MSMSRISKLVGIKGYYLSCCKSLRLNPWPVRIPIFGMVRTYHEIRNMNDNFGAGHLRDAKVEAWLAEKEAPCVIDCGVSVGVTVRWWFYLNRRAKVYGIDMMEEAQAFTLESIKSIGIDRGQYEPFTTALWSEDGKQFKVNGCDPLFGDSNLHRESTPQNERILTSRTLDALFDPRGIGAVDLLKIDLEGAGANALDGAAKLLKKTKHVVFEIHSEEETARMTKVLTESGFLLRRINDRILWWEKEKK